jgi:ABC-type Mn2+/Zn2+ transport system ATPase subunit
VSHSPDEAGPERTQAKPAVLIEGLRAGYGGQAVLLTASARLQAGRAAAVLGPNGSGKSTLLKVVLGLLEPWSGTVEVFGQGPHGLDRRRWQIGYMPQLREVDRAFPATVFDLAMMGRVGRLGLFRRPTVRDRELALNALSLVGLSDLAGRPFGALSGGQQQRAFLARALAQEPDLLVLDEPVAGVDAASRIMIGELLTTLRAAGVPLMVATHDLDEVHPFAFDEHWTLAGGRLHVDLPGSAREPHPADRHEDVPAGPRPQQRPARLGGWHQAAKWG